MKLVRLSLKERSYSICIGKDLLPQAGRFIKREIPSRRHALVVTQKEIALLYRDRLSRALFEEGFGCDVFITPPSKSSEAAKSHAVYLKLIRSLAASDGGGKSIFLVALGGGVIGDLTGFAASVYRRGVPYVQIPTTLTAQVDSAIGGKTGIDLPEGKNLVGSIYQPALVLSDTTLLASLPERHWSDGFSEVIKYGVIRDPAIFSLLEKHDKTDIRNSRWLEKVIFRSARIKAKIVERDEWDKKNLRIQLNFGHTIGHAIEAVSRFSRRYTHGEAVAIGMLAACDLSEKTGILKDRSLTARLERLLVKYELPVFYKGLKPEAILKAVGYDKKSEAGVNRFVLPVAMGKTVIAKDVPAELILEVLGKRKG